MMGHCSACGDTQFAGMHISNILAAIAIGLTLPAIVASLGLIR